jgi:hypothetical protein
MNAVDKRFAALGGVLTILLFRPAAADEQTVWRFDNLSRIGGIAPKVEGNPQLVESPLGKAVQFNGKDTALFFASRPLVGAKSFSIEVILRPEGGEFQQRWMHIAEIDPTTGRDSNPPKTTTDPNARYMYELRVVNDQWYPDAYVKSRNGTDKLLVFPDKLFPINRWYAVEQTYDGKTYRSYVNGVLQGEADYPGYAPQAEGHMMVGARLNRIDYFKGSVALARFTDRALSPAEFLKAP